MSRDLDEPVTVSATSRGVEIDPQNPLPEPSFRWRRVLTYTVVIAALLLTWHSAEALHHMGAASELLTLSKWTLGLAGLVATYYYIAPSAAELTSLIQSAKIIRGGIGLAGEPKQRSPDPRGQSPQPGFHRAPAAGIDDEEHDAAPRSRR